MQFSPTKQMRLAAAMRQSLSEEISRRGFCRKYLRRLKKIYLFEGAAYGEDFTDVYDLSALTDKLFCAAVLRLAMNDIFIFCRVRGRGIFKVNLRLYEAAVCSLAAVAENGAALEFRVYDNFIKLSVTELRLPPDIRALRLLGGTALKCVGEDGIHFFLPLEKSKEKIAREIKTEYLLDRYSVLNVFLLN